jgi:hypothetical protein
MRKRLRPRRKHNRKKPPLKPHPESKGPQQRPFFYARCAYQKEGGYGGNLGFPLFVYRLLPEGGNLGFPLFVYRLLGRDATYKPRRCQIVVVSPA